MSGVWNTAQVDLTLPSDGNLAPGGNTFYIGGPRLPPELTDAGANAALVWYTNSAGLAAGYDYWFLAHCSIDILIPEQMIFGYKKTADSGVSVLWSGTVDNTAPHDVNFFIQALGLASIQSDKEISLETPNGLLAMGAKDIIQQAADTLYIDARSVEIFATAFPLTLHSATSQLQISGNTVFDVASNYTHNTGGNFLVNSGANLTLIPNGGGSVRIGDPAARMARFINNANTTYMINTDPDLDTWFVSTSSQIVGGVAATACQAVWRINYLRMQEAHLQWVCPTAPANLNIALPMVPLFTAGSANMAKWRQPSALNATSQPVLNPTVLIGDNGAFGTNGQNFLSRMVPSDNYTTVTLAGGATNPNNLRRFFASFMWMADIP